MDVDARPDETKVTDERIKFIDSLTSNPEARAFKVFQVIKDYNDSVSPQKSEYKLSNWDLLCYSVSHLISLVTVYTWLRHPAKVLKNLVFNAHYLYPEGHGIIINEQANISGNRNNNEGSNNRGS